MSWDIKIFRSRGIVREVGSNDGDRYASSSSGEAMAIYLGQHRVFLSSLSLSRYMGGTGEEYANVQQDDL